jgi:hypothetical protein
VSYATRAGRALRLRVELWDRDSITKDDFVGAGMVDVTSSVSDHALAGARQALVCALRSPTGSAVGEVELLVSSRPGMAIVESSALPPVAGVVDVWVSSATNLKNMDSFTKQDPYVRISLVDAGGRTVRRTSTSLTLQIEVSRSPRAISLD